MAPKVLVEPRKPQLEQALASFTNLGWNGPARREDIANSKEGEHEAETRNLPRSVLSKR